MNHPWLILRILSGHPFRVEAKVKQLGVEAYCPRFNQTKRLRGWRLAEVERPLIPGYLFTAEPFDIDRVNLGHVKTRFMSRDGHFLTVTPIEMERIRLAELEAEGEWRIEEIVRSLASKKAKAKFVKLHDFNQKALAS